ncbi:hypothetical protein SAMN05444413_103106 [Roseivivax marinus]|nr:hypothetical protein SAMN05444413_103106 [Roseivivax marinus]
MIALRTVDHVPGGRDAAGGDGGARLGYSAPNPQADNAAVSGQ